MKEYCFTWFNHNSNEQAVDFVIAENLSDAKKIAILLMRLYGGASYNEYSIDNIYEVNKDDFTTMESLTSDYKKRNKQLIIPQLEEEKSENAVSNIINLIKIANSYIGDNGTRTRNTYNSIINNNHLYGKYRMTDKDAWSCAFATAICWEAGLKDIMPLECYIGKLVYECKKLGIYHSAKHFKPKAGDYVLFSYGEPLCHTPSHIGLIVNTSDDHIEVIEGNACNGINNIYCVMHKIYFKPLPEFICWYIRPKYGEVNKNEIS